MTFIRQNKNLYFAKISLLIAIYFSFLYAHAQSHITDWVEPIFGPEFTFAKLNALNGKIESPKERDANNYISWLLQHLITNQSKNDQFLFSIDDSELSTTSIGRTDELDIPHYIFESPEGWGFTVTSDPGVLEIKMPPKTNLFYSAHSANMQDAIFQSAHRVGLYPALFQGGGHVNIGKNIFEHDVLLFRNFLVDLINHSELALGIMNYDLKNAAPILMLDTETLKRLRVAIDDFDRQYSQKIEEQKSQLDFLAKRVHGLLYHSRYRHDMLSERGKHTAFSLIEFSTRFEIRSVRPQANFDVFVRQTRLFRNRLNYLKQIKRPIPVHPHIHVYSDELIANDQKYFFTPPVDPQAALRAFYSYVTEAGELWQDHRDYIWPAWVNPLNKTLEESELYKFEQSRWFKLRNIVLNHRQHGMQRSAGTQSCQQLIK